mmetsp:Transcript_29121/g.45638  ORF Transcript_29121/g.45638 Transcript_29121/m.45638 type:complete len:106 (-) Transcript_29121:146-463(-)
MLAPKALGLQLLLLVSHATLSSSFLSSAPQLLSSPAHRFSSSPQSSSASWLSVSLPDPQRFAKLSSKSSAPQLVSPSTPQLLSSSPREAPSACFSVPQVPHFLRS